MLVARRPSPALVVAALALVMSVAGNAAAAVIITANNQVAAHVIGGVNAPSGDNHNLIAGSVGTADLHAGAVTPVQLNGDARAHKIDFQASGVGTTSKTLLSLDELTVSAQCVGDDTNSISTLVVTASSSIAGSLEAWGVAPQTSGPPPVPVSVSDGLQPNLGIAVISITSATSGAWARRDEQWVYRNANRVITLTMTALTNASNNYECLVSGTAEGAATK
jgi:hypothetical protein